MFNFIVSTFILLVQKSVICSEMCKVDLFVSTIDSIIYYLLSCTMSACMNVRAHRKAANKMALVEQLKFSESESISETCLMTCTI